MKIIVSNLIFQNILSFVDQALLNSFLLLMCTKAPFLGSHMSAQRRMGHPLVSKTSKKKRKCLPSSLTHSHWLPPSLFRLPLPHATLCLILDLLSPRSSAPPTTTFSLLAQPMRLPWLWCDFVSTALLPLLTMLSASSPCVVWPLLPPQLKALIDATSTPLLIGNFPKTLLLINLWFNSNWGIWKP